MRSTLIIAACALMCSRAVGALFASRPPLIQSYEDQVAYALRTRRIAYWQIRFGERYPDQVNCRYGEYVGPITIAVYVTLHDGRNVAGWLERRRIAEQGMLSLIDLNMRLRCSRSSAGSALRSGWNNSDAHSPILWN